MIVWVSAILKHICFSQGAVLYLLFTFFTFQDEQIDLGKQELGVGEIQQKIKEYNAQINSNLYMVFVSDK